MSGTSSVEVGPKGRVVIPAAIRRELGIEEGTRLVALVEGGAVVLIPRAGVEERLLGMFLDVPTSIAQELIRERRREAAAEVPA